LEYIDFGCDVESHDHVDLAQGTKSVEVIDREKEGLLLQFELVCNVDGVVDMECPLFPVVPEFDGVKLVFLNE
jgi:hypothetical protein